MLHNESQFSIVSFYQFIKITQKGSKEEQNCVLELLLVK